MLAHWLVALLVIVAFGSAEAQEVWFVDKDNSSGIEDGTSWESAYRTIQPALDAASGETGGEVWVAQGVYSEQRVYIDEETQINIGAVYIPDGVSLYGGFSGGETSISERNITQNVTTIDASSARDGMAAYYVVFAGDNTVLDGFIVTGAVSNDGLPGTPFRSGGGWRSVSSESTATIRNCSFRSNTSLGGGAGLAFGNGELKVINCSFEENTGRACSLLKANVEFVGCTFLNNTANIAAGIYASGGSSLTIDKCVFHGNSIPSSSSSYEASAIYNSVGRTVITNSVFYNNTSGNVHGKTVFFQGSYDQVGGWTYGSAELTNCTFFGNNNSPLDAAIVYDTLAGLTVRNCIVRESVGGGVSQTSSGPGGYSTTEVLYSNIQGGLPWSISNPPGWLTVEGLIDADPLFVDQDNGDFRLRLGSPSIDTGTAEGAPDEDINGLPRPQGAGVDMGAHEATPFDRLDVNGDGRIDAVDVQLIINAALGNDPYDLDVNGDGVADALDVQLVINGALWPPG